MGRGDKDAGVLITLFFSLCQSNLQVPFVSVHLNDILTMR